MAKGYFRADPSWGCQACGDRNVELKKVKFNPRGHNVSYVCDRCIKRLEWEKHVMKESIDDKISAYLGESKTDNWQHDKDDLVNLEGFGSQTPSKSYNMTIDGIKMRISRKTKSGNLQGFKVTFEDGTVIPHINALTPDEAGKIASQKKKQKEFDKNKLTESTPLSIRLLDKDGELIATSNVYSTAEAVAFAKRYGEDFGKAKWNESTKSWTIVKESTNEQLGSPEWTQTMMDAPAAGIKHREWGPDADKPKFKLGDMVTYGGVKYLIDSMSYNQRLHKYHYVLRIPMFNRYLGLYGDGIPEDKLKKAA